MKKKNKRLRILIAGWYGQHNAGDEALLLQFIDEMHAFGGCDITVLSQRPEEVETLYGHLGVKSVLHVPTLGRSSLIPWIKGKAWRLIREIYENDLVVIGGGSIIRDLYAFRTLLLVLDEIWWAKIFRNKVITYAVSVGPFKHNITRHIATISLSLCDAIIVRDKKSIYNLRSSKRAAEKAELVFDPAILLEPEDPPEAVIAWINSLRSTFSGALITVGTTEQLGANLSESSRQKLMEKIANAITTFWEENDGFILFIPFQKFGKYDDVFASNQIAKYLGKNVRWDIIRDVTSPRQIKKLIAISDLNVAIRLHSLIFAFSENVKCVSIVYDDKIKDVSESSGLKKFLVEPNENIEKTLYETMNVIMDRDSLGGKIHKRRRSKAVASAKKTFKIISKILNDI